MKYANVRKGCIQGDCTLAQTTIKLQCAEMLTKQLSGPGPGFNRFLGVLMARVSYADNGQ